MFTVRVQVYPNLRSNILAYELGYLNQLIIIVLGFSYVSFVDEVNIFIGFFIEKTDFMWKAKCAWQISVL